MKAIIISAGEILNFDFYKSIKVEKDDIVICADGGYKSAKMLGITPHYVVGDFDSNSLAIDDNVKIVKYDTKKDYTDTFLATSLALKKGYKDFLFLGAIGSRQDHSLANISILKYLLDRGCFGKIINENNEIFLIKKRAEIKGEIGDIISLLPLFSKAYKVTTDGLLYPLSSGTLKFEKSIGISNVFTKKVATVEVLKGIIIAILARD